MVGVKGTGRAEHQCNLSHQACAAPWSSDLLVNGSTAALLSLLLQLRMIAHVHITCRWPVLHVLTLTTAHDVKPLSSHALVSSAACCCTGESAG